MRTHKGLRMKPRFTQENSVYACNLGAGPSGTQTVPGQPGGGLAGPYSRGAAVPGRQGLGLCRGGRRARPYSRGAGPPRPVTRTVPGRAAGSALLARCRAAGARDSDCQCRGGRRARPYSRGAGPPGPVTRTVPGRAAGSALLARCRAAGDSDCAGAGGGLGLTPSRAVPGRRVLGLCRGGRAAG